MIIQPFFYSRVEPKTPCLYCGQKGVTVFAANPVFQGIINQYCESRMETMPRIERAHAVLALSLAHGHLQMQEAQ